MEPVPTFPALGFYVDSNVNFSATEEESQRLHKALKTELIYNPSILFLVIFQERLKIWIEEGFVHHDTLKQSTIHTGTGQNSPRYPSTDGDKSKPRMAAQKCLCT